MALVGAAHTLARWYGDSALGRSLGAAGSGLTRAAAGSALGRLLVWDLDDSWRRSASFGSLSALAQRFVAWSSRWLTPVLDGSWFVRSWNTVAGWFGTATPFADSRAVQLVRWYFCEETVSRPMPADPAGDVPTTRPGIAALQGLTVVVLHALVWTVPTIEWAKLLIVMLALTVLMSLRWLAGERLRGGGLFVPVFAYVVFAALASLSSITVFGSLRDLGLLLGGAGVLFAIINLRDRRAWVGLLGSVVAVAALVSLYGLYQYVRGTAVASRAWFDINTNPELTSRVFSTFGNPNTLAMYLEFSLPLTVGLLWSERSRLKQLLYMAAALVMLAALVLTMSRGGWLALVFGGLVFLALTDSRVLWALPLAGAVAYAFLPPVFRTRLATIGSLKDASNAYRVNIWLAAIYMIGEFWPTGVGFGYRAFMPIYNYFRLRGQPAFHAHNFYLEQFAELGIIGFILFLWLICRIGAAGVRGLALGRDPRLRAVSIGGLAGLAGILLHGMFENIFYLPTIIAAFWVAMGIMAAGTELAAGEQAH